MKKLIIKNLQNEDLQFAIFDNEENLNSFIEVLNNGLTCWGKPEHQVLLSPEQTIQIEAVLDEEGNELEPARTEIIEAVYETIPSEFTYTIEDITAEAEKQNRIQAKLAIGQITDKACNDAFMYIQGANVERELTSEQKTQMVSLFAPALQAIQVKRPGQLKAYINSINPDGVLITAEMKEDLLEILKVF